MTATAKDILELLHKSELGSGETGNKALMSWGANSFVGSVEPDEYGIAWIRFNVHGSKYQGNVRVALQRNNLFRITLEKLNNKAGNSYVARTCDLVYPAKLLVILDSEIEGGGIRDDVE